MAAFIGNRETLVMQIASRRVAARARSVLTITVRRPALALAIVSLGAWLPTPVAAQLGPKDLLLSAPGVGAIWRVDGTTGVGAAWAQSMEIPHYGWVAPDGNFYVPDRGYLAIMKIAPDGTPTILTSGGHLQMPVTCIPSLDGQALVVSDMLTNKIVRIGYDGSQLLMHDAASTGGMLSGPDGIAYDDAGNLFVANILTNTIIRIDGQGQATLFSDAPFISQPGGLALDGAGNLFVANYGTSTIARFRLDTGEGAVFAGPELDKIHNPNDLKLSRSGGLITSGRPGKVVRIDALGHMEVIFSDPTLGELDGVSAPEDVTLCSGRFSTYGAGEPGSGGLTPKFRALFSPCGGQTIGLELLDFVGGAPAVMFVGSAALAPGVLKFKGASLLVDPAGALFVPVAFALPGSGAGLGDLTLQFVIPSLPQLVGLDLYHQVFAADPGALHGVSASNGLKETVGS